MIRFDGSDPIDGFVERFPAAGAVLEHLGIDCKRQDSLAAAIEQRGLERTVALGELAAAATLDPEHPDEDWSSYALDELVDHLEGHHHRFTREALARLDALIACARPEPLHERFIAFKHFLLCHIEEEEQDFFVQCRLLETDPQTWRRSDCNLRRMTSAVNREHDEIADRIEEIMHLVRDCDWPTAMLDQRQAFIQGVEVLAEDLAVHTHLEYEFLIPSALHSARLERSRIESQIQRDQRERDAAQE
ncbi:MAG: hemerythrin domain-containing protein [Planctomycetota bacterium]